MIMLDILFPFNLLFLEISRNSLVGDELPPDDPFLSRPFKVKGCRTEIESLITEGGVNLKTRGCS